MSIDQLEALMDEPGERQPFVSAGELRAMLALLDLLDEKTQPQTYELAQELRVRVGRRLPC